MNQIRNLIAQLGPRRLAIMGGVALALLAGIALLAMRGTTSEMGYLYTDLDPSAARGITEKLNGQGVPFRLSADGTAVMAPVDRLPELRMAMASDKLGGKIGYEVLDQEEPFGLSSSRARMNEARAIEGELSRSIQSLEEVDRARVHIVMPEHAMFAATPRKATAAVTVKTRGRLTGENVQAIRYLVSSSVPELSPDNVSIVDQSGALLARAGEGGATGSAGNADERQQAVEARLRGQIEQMLEPVVGAGKVRAEVTAMLNRDQTRKESETFDPDTQVIAHQVTVEANAQNDETNASAEGVTVAQQLPETQTPIAGGGQDARRARKNETSEDITYQNSRTQTVSVSDPGKIERLSVAVMVDGGEKGLTAAQTQRLSRLVENAVGYDAARGDNVIVENMRFVDPEAASGMSGGMPFGITTDHIVTLLGIVLAGGAVLAAIRMTRSKSGGAAEGEGEEDPLLPSEPDMRQLTLRAAEGDEEAIRLLEALRAEETDTPLLDQEIALAQVDGRIKLSALRRIGNAVSANPTESAAIVRQWMNA